MDENVHAMLWVAIPASLQHRGVHSGPVQAPQRRESSCVLHKNSSGLVQEGVLFQSLHYLNLRPGAYGCGLWVKVGFL